MRIYPGTRFYKQKNDGSIDLVKIKRFKNSETVTILNSDGSTTNMKLSDITSDYVGLKPDGMMVFSIANLSDVMQDVMVTLHRQSDIDSNVNTPYVVCRQCITDIFANQLAKDGTTYYGSSVSVETCPADVDFDIMLTCDSVSYNEFVSVYIDDKLDDILSCVNTNKYNNVLMADYLDYAKAKSKDFGNLLYRAIVDSEFYEGYCKDLKTLLTLNNFMFDFYRTFNIYPIDFEDLDTFASVNGSLPPQHVKVLSNLLCQNITDTIVLKYSKDIDTNKMDKAGNRYVLVSDSKQDVYLVAYKTKGIYHIPVESIETKDNIYNLSQVMGKRTKENSSLAEAYDKIILNKDKYDV